ncbi:hypothetical protein G9A89_000954 [Geosiphon pyriformis]|nr:hypothetical protein G9A89_000954 [Geosiphon pyriformis]
MDLYEMQREFYKTRADSSVHTVSINPGLCVRHDEKNYAKDCPEGKCSAYYRFLQRLIAKAE